MSTAPALREEAYKIWLLEGTDEGTANRLRQKYSRLGHLNRKTVGRWREEGNWEERKNADGDADVLTAGQGRPAPLDSGLRRNDEVKDGDRESRLWKILDDGIAVLEKAPLEDTLQVVQVAPTVYKLLEKIMKLRQESRKMSEEQKLEAGRRFLAALNNVPEIARVLTDPAVVQKLSREVEKEFGSL